MTTLINFSGGIDSTYCLYKYMKDIKQPSERVIVHHNILINSTNRWNKESEACKNILEWLKQNNLDNFTYVETTFKQPDNFLIPLDSILHMGYISGIIGKTYSITHQVYSTPKDEYERLGYEEMHRRNTNVELIRKMIYDKDVQIISFIDKTYKQDIMQQMPSELLDLCWYCRTPSKEGKPCGKCHTCKQVIKAKENIVYN